MRFFDPDFKLQVVLYAERGNSNCAAGRQFGVSEKLVRDWKKKKIHLIETVRLKRLRGFIGTNATLLAKSDTANWVADSSKPNGFPSSVHSFYSGQENERIEECEWNPTVNYSNSPSNSSSDRALGDYFEIPPTFEHMLPGNGCPSQNFDISQVKIEKNEGYEEVLSNELGTFDYVDDLSDHESNHNREEIVCTKKIQSVKSESRFFPLIPSNEIIQNVDVNQNYEIRQNSTVENEHLEIERARLNIEKERLAVEKERLIIETQRLQVEKEKLELMKLQHM